MPYVIRSYEGNDEWVSKKWLAHMNLGSDIYMSFFGATKEEAESRARAWYEKEKSRWERIEVLDSKPTPKPVDDGWNSWNNPDQGWDKEIALKPSGKGHHFAGKVWMVKRDGAEKHKVRIDPSQVAAYEAQGYVRGGPRS